MWKVPHKISSWSDHFLTFFSPSCLLLTKGKACLMMSPMNTFFCVKETIPPGIGFSLFSSGHLIWLSSIALVTVLAALLYRKSSDKTRFIIRLVISILLLADEAVKQILLFSSGQFNWSYLPLHLCSINIFIVLIHVITGSRYVAEALFALCLPAAAAALLFCSWTTLPLFNLMVIHSFTVHALLFMYPVLLLAGGLRPDVKRLVRIIPFLAIVLIVIQIINVGLGTSFFFINGAGEGNPLSLLEDVFGRPWYLIPAFFLVVILWCVMYSVSAFAFRIKGKKG